jgi:hypothetical protein
MIRSSSKSSKSVTLTFHNDTQDNVVCFWIDFEGKERGEYKTVLTPGAGTSSQTYVGHVWRFKNEQEDVLAHFAATMKTPSPSVISIQELKSTSTGSSSSHHLSIPKVKSEPKLVQIIEPVTLQDGLKSVGGGKKITVTFHNELDEDLDFFWVDWNGSEIFSGTLQPGSTGGSCTYAGHPWVFRTKSRVCASFWNGAKDTPDSYTHYINASTIIEADPIETDEFSSCIDALNRFKRGGWRSMAFEDSPHIIESILNELKQTGKRFIDNEFVPEEKWTHVTELFEGECQLYVNDVSPEDIIQGSVGNCWLMQAIGGAATKPNVIKDIFKYCTPESTKQGVFIVRLYYREERVAVVLDGYLPTDQYGSLLYSRMAEDGEIWVCLLEKAFAKLSRSYANLDGSRAIFNPASALVAMLSGTAKSIHWINQDTDAARMMRENRFWSYVENIRNSGSIVVCTSRSGEVKCAVDKFGIVDYHGYSILDIKHFKEVNLVRVRNTWGQTEWNGDWSDNSSIWDKYPLIKHELKNENKNDGIFWISTKDFEVHFSVIWWNQL